MPNSGANTLGVISTAVRSMANPIANLALCSRILRTQPPPVNNPRRPNHSPSPQPLPVVPTEVESLP